jgi:hypothetical protein
LRLARHEAQWFDSRHPSLLAVLLVRPGHDDGARRDVGRRAAQTTTRTSSRCPEVNAAICMTGTLPSMLVVRVELWPGGDSRFAREIGWGGFANVSGLADVSDYVCVLNDDAGAQVAVMVRGHERAAGFWPLLARAFTPESRDAVPDDLRRLVSAISERLSRR